MHKRIKITLSLFLALAGTSFVHAQNDFHEIGTRFSSFDDFGVIYKKQTDENRYTRYNLAFTNIGVTTGNLTTAFNGGVGFGMGWEKRNELSEKLQFVHGFNPSASVNHTDAGNGVTAIGLSLGYILGVQYNVSSEIYVSIEAVPSLTVTGLIPGGEQSSTFNFNVGGNSQNAALTVAYRFQRK